jgi:hypothetical protein
MVIMHPASHKYQICQDHFSRAMVVALEGLEVQFLATVVSANHDSRLLFADKLAFGLLQIILRRRDL